eukprot:gene108-751_t
MAPAISPTAVSSSRAHFDSRNSKEVDRFDRFASNSTAANSSNISMSDSQQPKPGGGDDGGFKPWRAGLTKETADLLVLAGGSCLVGCKVLPSDFGPVPPAPIDYSQPNGTAAAAVPAPPISAQPQDGDGDACQIVANDKLERTQSHGKPGDSKATGSEKDPSHSGEAKPAGDSSAGGSQLARTHSTNSRGGKAASDKDGYWRKHGDPEHE